MGEKQVVILRRDLRLGLGFLGLLIDDVHATFDPGVADDVRQFLADAIPDRECRFGLVLAAGLRRLVFAGHNSHFKGIRVGLAD